MIEGSDNSDMIGHVMDGPDSLFFKRDILIATSHKKEVAIGPALRERFQANIFTPEGFNTDVFGTFSGEIERKDSPLEAARRKSSTAASAFNARLVIASEGSFGPHPTLFFVPGDDEVLLLTDYDHNLEIAVRHISTKTNFSGKLVETYQDVKHFANAIGFPDHKVIVRKAHEDNTHIVKDIADWRELEAVTSLLLHQYGIFFIETDMRAMNNPLRMSVIAKAAEKLANLMATGCPACKTPGFDVGEVIPGLPCQLCTAPTRSTLKKVYICKQCNYSEDLFYPNKKNVEEPMFCDWCNP